MVAHHNSIHEFMRIFNRKELVVKKPVYCWTCAIKVEINDNSTGKTNEVFQQIKVIDFKIINE